MRRRAAAILGTIAVAAVVVAGPAAAGAGSSWRLPGFGPGRGSPPHIHPANFSPNVTNKLFPLTPGQTLVYTGIEDEQKVLDLVVPSRRTKLVDGVRARVVEDRVYLDNVLAERTSDYYAQDRCGNVWYFGEDTAELDRHGNVVSTEGTWRAGVDGAQPGVFMQAHPQVNDHYFQELAAPLAQDEATVLSLHETASVPLAKFRNCLLTKEFTQLEPGNVEHKF